MSKIERVTPEIVKKLKEQMLSVPYSQTKAQMQSVFQKMENGQMYMPKPDCWLGNTWDDHKKAVFSMIERKRAQYEDSECLKSLEFTECVKQLSDVKLGHPVDYRNISAIEHSLHVQFAEEFKTYLSYCGTLDICGSEAVGFMGIDTKNDICDSMQICKQKFPHIPDDMYPVCGLNSEKTSILLYLQDKDGYVYLLDKKNHIVPACLSLQHLIILLYYMVKDGDL